MREGVKNHDIHCEPKSNKKLLRKQLSNIVLKPGLNIVLEREVMHLNIIACLFPHFIKLKGGCLLFVYLVGLCVPISPYANMGLHMREGVGMHTLWVQILVGFEQKIYIMHSNILKIPYPQGNKTSIQQYNLTNQGINSLVFSIRLSTNYNSKQTNITYLACKVPNFKKKIKIQTDGAIILDAMASISSAYSFTFCFETLHKHSKKKK